MIRFSISALVSLDYGNCLHDAWIRQPQIFNSEQMVCFVRQGWPSVLNLLAAHVRT